MLSTGTPAADAMLSMQLVSKATMRVELLMSASYETLVTVMDPVIRLAAVGAGVAASVAFVVFVGSK
jgi:hypothetical protein